MTVRADFLVSVESERTVLLIASHAKRPARQTAMIMRTVRFMDVPLSVFFFLSVSPGSRNREYGDARKQDARYYHNNGREG